MKLKRALLWEGMPILWLGLRLLWQGLQPRRWSPPSLSGLKVLLQGAV